MQPLFLQLDQPLFLPGGDRPWDLVEDVARDVIEAAVHVPEGVAQVVPGAAVYVVVDRLQPVVGDHAVVLPVGGSLDCLFAFGFFNT